MVWNERIKELRKKHGLTLVEVANKIKVSEATAQRYESKNGIKNIPYDAIVDLASLYGVTPQYIMGWEDSDTSLPSDTIPILGVVTAGRPIFADENIIGYTKNDISEDCFGLRIQGDSMIPDIHDGDIVIVRQQPDAENGEVVVAMVNSDDAVCKRLMKYSWGLQLMSDNPAYEPLVFSAEEVEDKPVRILGKVVELRRKY